MSEKLQKLASDFKNNMFGKIPSPPGRKKQEEKLKIESLPSLNDDQKIDLNKLKEFILFVGQGQYNRGTDFIKNFHTFEVLIDNLSKANLKLAHKIQEIIDNDEHNTTYAKEILEPLLYDYIDLVNRAEEFVKYLSRISPNFSSDSVNLIELNIKDLMTFRQR